MKRQYGGVHNEAHICREADTFLFFHIDLQNSGQCPLHCPLEFVETNFVGREEPPCRQQIPLPQY